MRKLYVSVEIEGRQREVGSIVGDTEFSAEFRYSDDYLESPQSRPISISLPLTDQAYGPEETRRFFEGLLPEGFLRRTVAENNRTDSNDYLTLLEMLGSECLGAIQIKGDEYHAVEPSYREFDPEMMFDLASEGASLSADLVVEAHLSLTGASGKVGAYHDADAGRWYLPIGSAPSTHILKQSHIRYDRIVQNEQLAQLTAEQLGISVPHSEIIRTSADGARWDRGIGGQGAVRNGGRTANSGNTDAGRSGRRRIIGDSRDATVLFATERYDRTMEGSVRTIDGLPCPLRLHQEDFGQALGIAAANKYEHGGEQHMKQMFDLLRRYSASPIEDQMKLWDIIVFHYLIGNTDGHIKNFSLLYDRQLRSVRLAPAYDVISTVVYGNHSWEMAFAIGGEMDWYKMDRACFERAADEIGLNRRIFMRRFDDMAARFDPALSKAADAMSAAGYTEAAELAAEIRNLREKQPGRTS